MNSIIKTPQASARAGLLGSLVIAGCALAAPAFAADGTSTADNMIVVRDAETGQMRAPTAAEAEALQQKALEKSGASTARKVVENAPLKTQAKQHRSGAFGARVNDDLASFVVVQRQADGTVAEACLPAAEAEKVVREGKPLPVETPAQTTVEK